MKNRKKAIKQLKELIPNWEQLSAQEKETLVHAQLKYTSQPKKPNNSEGLVKDYKHHK